LCPYSSCIVEHSDDLEVSDAVEDDSSPQRQIECHEAKILAVQHHFTNSVKNNLADGETKCYVSSSKALYTQKHLQQLS
jgi:hypothetical protein